MPSPLGHTLAGLAVGIATDPKTASGGRPFRAYLTSYAILCAFLAAAPDLDLLLHRRIIWNFHRTATHSLFAVAAVFIVTALVTGEVTRRPRRWINATTFALAWASHLLMDWLGADPSRPSGIQLLWPLSDQFFVSGIDYFPATERDTKVAHFFIQNARAATVEALTGGVLLALALYANSRRGGGPSDGPVEGSR
jgi:membrane-bound metal-dependent hydrolase YbcI (DUF457 family)